MNTRMNSFARAVSVVGACIAVTAMLPTQPAAAATLRNGVCESGEFCYYWGSNNSYAVSDLPRQLKNYGDTQPTCYDYKGSLGHSGECIKNNARSVWNRTPYEIVVGFHSNCGGPFQTVASGERANLGASDHGEVNLSRENASHCSEVG